MGGDNKGVGCEYPEAGIMGPSWRVAGSTGLFIKNLGCRAGGIRASHSVLIPSPLVRNQKKPHSLSRGSNPSALPVENGSLPTAGTILEALKTFGGNGRDNSGCVTSPGISCFVTETQFRNYAGVSSSC